MIKSNSYRVFPAPTRYKDHFVFGGRRYFRTDSNCLINDVNRFNFLPPADRGFYIPISAKEFNEAKLKYLAARKQFSDALLGNPNKGVQASLF